MHNYIDIVWNGVLFNLKRNKIMLFAATWMDLEINILSKVSQTNIILYHSYVEFLKNDTNELIYKTETDSDIKENLIVIKRER